MRTLKGKVIIVTGASRGIGRAAARLLAEDGARLVLAARGEGPLAEVAAEVLGLGGEALAIPTDVTRWEACANLAKQALVAYGAIDVLVNNAGVGWVAPLVDHPLDQWHHVVDTNLHGVFYAIKAVLPSAFPVPLDTSTMCQNEDVAEGVLWCARMGLSGRRCRPR